MSEISPVLSAPRISQTYIIRESYKDIISATSPILRRGNNLALDLLVKVEVNSQPSQRIINFLKCLSILSFLPENALKQAVSQLENIRNNDSQHYVLLPSVDLRIHWHETINSSSQPSSKDSNKYSSFPRIASLVGNLEKDYESLCSNYLKTIETAERLIERLHSVALKNNWWWCDPLLNISFENEIVLEWWNQEKKITIYVYEEVIDYIKVWGADMDNEMEDGSISLDEDLTDLWQWIASSR
ncbi:hypothetical protein OSCI_2310005 [Kamptonema sp. PCC 6506]|nr:hypothetical protein OSCI_2310005 [Kamptonema sp. PCC 6506]